MLSIIFVIPEILYFNRFPIYFFQFQEGYTIIFNLLSHITNIYLYISLLIPTWKLIHDPNNGIFDPKKVAYLTTFKSLKICSTNLPSCLFLNSNIIYETFTQCLMSLQIFADFYQKFTQNEVMSTSVHWNVYKSEFFDITHLSESFDVTAGWLFGPYNVSKCEIRC